jgi:hypothetical protein
VLCIGAAVYTRKGTGPRHLPRDRKRREIEVGFQHVCVMQVPLGGGARG